MTEPLEVAAQACARLGFKAGDTLTSRFWDGVPLKIERIELASIWVTRLHEVAPGDWREGASHSMRYLPRDVARIEKGKGA